MKKLKPSNALTPEAFIDELFTKPPEERSFVICATNVTAPLEERSLLVYTKNVTSPQTEKQITKEVWAKIKTKIGKNSL
jgi:hypothetical protein